MATREIMMILRARNEASRVLRDVGTGLNALSKQGQRTSADLFAIGAGLTGMGVAIGGIGIAGMNFFKQNIDLAVEYGRQAAYTRTQIDEMGVTVKQVEQLGLRVARTVGVPLKEVQEGMFDLFSSIDVKFKDAEGAVTSFAKAAIAGQTDIRTVARGTIAILNVFGMDISRVNEVLDVQFQLFRRGIGTFEEIAGAIGRVAPAAKIAGVSIQDMGGFLQFMSRRSSTFAQAVTSTARAFENLAHPKVVERLEEMGIKVKDNEGNFRRLVDVIGDMAAKLGNLPAAERAARLFEIFKGAGGTIQSRRFWDVAITDFQSLRKEIEQAGNSVGEFQRVYEIMAGTPAIALQILRTRWEALRVEIGEMNLPVLQAFMKALQRLFDLWDRLGPTQKQAIVQFALIASVVATIGGAILTTVGAFFIFLAILKSVTGSTIGAIALLLGLGGAFGAVLAAIGAFVLNVGGVRTALSQVWKAVRDDLKNVAGIVRDMSEDMYQAFQRGGWKAAFAVLKDYWPDIRDALVDAWNHGVDAFMKTGIGKKLQGVWDDLFKGKNPAQVAIEVVNYLIQIAERIDLPRIIGRLVERFAESAATIAGAIANALTKVDWAKLALGLLEIADEIIRGLVTGFYRAARENPADMVKLLVLLGIPGIGGALTKVLAAIPIVGPLLGWFGHGVGIVGKRVAERLGAAIAAHLSTSAVSGPVAAAFSRMFGAAGPVFAVVAAGIAGWAIGTLIAKQTEKWAEQNERTNVRPKTIAEDLIKSMERLERQGRASKDQVKAVAEAFSLLKISGDFSAESMGRVLTNWDLIVRAADLGMPMIDVIQRIATNSDIAGLRIKILNDQKLDALTGAAKRLADTLGLPPEKIHAAMIAVQGLDARGFPNLGTQTREIMRLFGVTEAQARSIIAAVQDLNNQKIFLDVYIRTFGALPKPGEIAKGSVARGIASQHSGGPVTIRKAHSGEFIQGAGRLLSDEVLRTLQIGEWVTDRYTVRRLGPTFMRLLPQLARRNLVRPETPRPVRHIPRTPQMQRDNAEWRLLANEIRSLRDNLGELKVQLLVDGDELHTKMKRIEDRHGRARK